MSVDDASRAVQHWPVGERGMSEMRSGTARYHFITWRACVSKYDRAQVRQALQTPPEKQIRTYLCVYCGQFAVNISRHLQAFNEKGKKGCNMRFVDDCSLRTHISSIAAASAASAGTKPRSHLENVHANLTGQMTEMRQALEEQTQAQAAHRQAVRAQTALSQDANTSLAAAVLSVKRKVDVLVPDEEQLKCMACSDDVPATDAVRCDADAQKEHSLCQTCFVEQSAFDLSQRECKCQVFNCGGKLRPPANMNTATFDFFIIVRSLMAEREVAKTTQQEKERIGKMSPTARLVEVLRETLVPKCPGTSICSASALT